jgi:hypothetical protein
MASALGREERLEDLLQIFPRDARAAVLPSTTHVVRAQEAEMAPPLLGNLHEPDRTVTGTTRSRSLSMPFMIRLETPGKAGPTTPDPRLFRRFHGQPLSLESAATSEINSLSRTGLELHAAAAREREQVRVQVEQLLHLLAEAARHAADLVQACAPPRGFRSS